MFYNYSYPCHGRERKMPDSETGSGAPRSCRFSPEAGFTGQSAALQTLVSGVQNGVAPVQYMRSIDIASRQLGNRAFMHWVGALQAGGVDAADRDAGAQDDPPTVPLQLMPKKRKKKTAVAETPEALQEEVPGTSAAGPQAAIAPVSEYLNIREKGLVDSCLKGDVRRFRRLLRFGSVDVNMAVECGTFLTIAAFSGYMAITRELLSMPAVDVNRAQWKGATPLFMAAQQGHEDLVRLLLTAPGIDPNLGMYNRKTTPLIIAAYKGREEVVKILLTASSVRINLRQTDGSTAIFAATQANFPGIVEALARRGADVNLTLFDGTSPLCHAAFKGNIEVLKRLLQAPGILVDQRSGKQATALFYAAREGQKEAVELLLAKGADLDIADENQVGPLHIACLHGRTEIVELLLNAGADMELKAKQEYTCYEIARIRGHRVIMRLIEERRPDREGRQAHIEELSPCLRPAEPAPAKAGGQALQDQPEPAGTVQADVASAASPETPPDSLSAAAKPQSPLERAKTEFIGTVLDKLRNDWLDPLDGIRLLEQVNTVADLDSLCTIFNRLAGIERKKFRSGRRPLWRGVQTAEEPPADAGPYRFALEEKQDLDAEAVEDEIKRRLEQSYHRFVSQAVNDMEFGRGKLTTGYPGLLHASAGIAGVGSCSVFFYADADVRVIRIVGIGHHLDRGTYRLDYAAAELRGLRTIRLS